MQTIAYLVNLLAIFYGRLAQQVLQVSDNPLFSNASPTGSLNGGAVFYIKGSGFDAMSGMNEVFVGIFPCPVKEYFTSETFLVCQMAAQSYGEADVVLDVEVHVNGVPFTCADAAKCKVSLQYGRSPSLKAVVPQAAIAGSYVTLVGYFFSSSSDKIKEIKVGGYNCAVSEDDVQSMSQYDTFASFKCYVSPDIPSDDYLMTVTAAEGTGFSTAFVASKSYKVGFSQTSFNLRIHPALADLSAHTGYVDGQIVTLTGTGFGDDASKVTVTYRDLTCKVLSVSDTSVKCELQADAGAAPPTSFVNGAGLERRVYPLNLSVSSLLSRPSYPNNDSPVIDVGLTTENSLKKTAYTQRFFGLFRAPATGSYTFYLSSDDQSSLRFSTTAFDPAQAFSEASLTEICKVTGYTQFRSFYEATTQRCTVSLEADKYYYTLLIHTQGYGADHLSLGVTVPNSDAAQPNTKPAVKKLFVQNTPVREVNTYTLKGATGGTYRILFYAVDANNKELVNKRTGDIAFDASAQAVSNAIRSSTGYNVQVARATIDANDAVTADPAAAVGYKYTITYNSYRSPQPKPFVLKSTLLGTVTSVAEVVTPPSAPVTGSFFLSVNGKTAGPFQFNTYGKDFQTTLGKLADLSLGVSVSALGDPNDGLTWYIRLDSLKTNPDFTIVENTIAGGPEGTPATLVIENAFEPPSNDLYYMPIPSDLLFSVGATPEFRVKVGDYFAACSQANCAYALKTADKSPVIESFAFTGSNLVITLNSGYSALEDAALLVAANLSVSFSKSACAISSVALPAITCAMPTNTDTTLNIAAGSFKPKVHLANKGFFSATAVAQNFALAVTAASPSAGSVGGNTPITITGTGFSAQSTVTVNGNPCVVESITNIAIVCRTPPQGSTAAAAAIVVTEEALTATGTGLFTYDDTITPKITALSKSSSSPVLKSSLVITGTNLGAAIADLEVYLVGQKTDGTKLKLPCNPVTLSGNDLTCALGGGPTAEYRVLIYKKNIGDSISNPVDANKFAYSLTVSNVTPMTGSKAGGQKITITGTNFSTVLNENQVVINKILCEVLTATATQITAIMPALPNASTMEYPIYVMGRVVEEAVCDPAVCKFTYSDDSTPTVTAIAPATGGAATSVTITGTKLDDANIAISFGAFDITSITTKTATSVTFDIPVARAFKEAIKVLIPTMGFALVSEGIEFENTFTLASVTPATGSKAGNILTLAGNGFNPAAASVKVGTIDCAILTITPAAISCWFENLVSYDTDYSVTVTQGAATASCETCKYHSLQLTSTPVISAISATSFTTPSAISFTVSGTLLGDGTTATAKLISRADPKQSYAGTITNNAGTLTLDFTSIPVGTYKLAYNIASVGFAHISAATPEISVAFAAADFTGATSQVSYAGGFSYTLAGKGMLATGALTPDAVTVCGQKAKVTSSAFDSLTFVVPKLVTPASNQLFALETEKPIKPKVITSLDNLNNAPKAFDDDFTTVFSSGSNSCWFMYDYGQNFVARITKISLFPDTTQNPKNLAGATIQGSSDGTNWTTLITVPLDVVTNWNYYNPPEAAPTSWAFRYIRFFGKGCKVAELSVWGVVTYSGSADATSDSCDVVLTMQGKTLTLAGKVQYRKDKTAAVTSIAPTMGSTAGGDVLTITGSGFNPATDTVVIDNIPCPVDQGQSSATVLKCTTGARPLFVPPLVAINTATGLASLGASGFLYISRWSDPNTWSGESAPREGDSVFVPEGQHLVIDTSPPYIFAMIVEGSVMWDDSADMTFDASFITVRMGKLQIGTEESPYQHKLTIKMHGTRSSKMLPFVGNKNIMVMSGKIDIHGAPKTPSWTLLAASVSPGATAVALQQEVNWGVGDEIVVASTSFSRDEFERRFITGVSVDKKTLTLDKALDFAHFAETLTYDGSPYEVRAEVAVLTRNVRVIGDDDSDKLKYGAHILLMGRDGNLRGRISNLEMFRCGQAFEMGRYPLHFHLAGNVINSYIRNNSVHDSFNRGTTVHGVHFLTVKDNVYLNHMGHGIFIEDSVESNNVIEGNLVMRTTTSASLLMSDLKPAAFWITRPKNFIRYNHAAGSTHFGFWYDLPGNPTGPSATTTVCPSGEPLGQFHHNVGHTNGIGLRIYPIYIPRTKPCESVSSSSTADPFANNPSVIAEYTDNLMFANGQGFFGRNLGAVQLLRTAFISNGMNAAVAEPDAALPWVPRIENSIFVGKVASWHALQGVQSWGAFTTGRRDGFMLKNVKFIDFSDQATMFHTCEGCGNELHRDIGARQTRFEQLTFTNVAAKMIQYDDALRDKDILEDTDGSLLRKMGVAGSTGGWIVPYFKYLDSPGCTLKITDTALCSEPCLVCDKTATLRRLEFRIPESVFDGLDMKVLNYQVTNTMNVPDNFSVVTFRYVPIQNWRGWALPFNAGQKYNVHWSTGVDFGALQLTNNILYQSNDPGFFVRVNNTYQRELYESHFRGIDGAIFTNDLNLTMLAGLPTPANTFGQFYYTNTTNTSLLKIDGARRGRVTYTASICKYFCPVETPPGVVETTIRYWSAPASWLSNKIPVAGDLVVVEANWNMVLDIDTPLLEKLTIKGKLSFSDTPASLTIRTKNVDIALGGLLEIGTSTTPYTKKATIQLEGDKTNPQIVLDPVITPGMKALVVKGKLSVFGAPKAPVTSRLTQEALKGATSVRLAHTTNWDVGDELVLASSTRNPTDVDYVTIVTKVSGSEFVVSPALKFDHYGASQPLTTLGKRVLDMRAEVSVINRNVVIKGTTDGNLGCRILVPGYQNFEVTPTQTVIGTIDLNYAEVNYCGQKDTEQAAIDIQGVTLNLQRLVGNSIRNGIAWGMNLQNSRNILVDNNIITNQTKTGVRLKNARDVLFQNNVITLINNRTDYNNNQELLDLIIGFHYEDPKPLKEANVVIRDNIVSSTSWFDWAVPGYDCAEDATNFFNNTGHSARAGWFGLKTNSACMKYSDFIGYLNFDEGFAHRFAVRNIKVTRMLVADNLNGVAINGGDPGDSLFPIVDFTNSEIYGQVLKDCSFCYKTAESCPASGLYTALFENGEFVMEFEQNRLPLHNTTATDYLWGAVQTVEDVTFAEFRTTEVCSQSFAIRSNNFIQDTSAYVKLKNVQYKNVDYNNTIFFFNHTRTKNPGFCSKRDCTGIYNLLISDTTGGIFGSPKVFFGFNKPAGNEGNCTFEPRWNGHACNPVYSLLSIQQPAQGRPVVITPLTITLYNNTLPNVSPDLQYSNTVDNERKIPAVVKKFGYHNLSLQGTMPNNMFYKLDSEEASDWAVFRIQHSDPSTMTTLVNGVAQEPKIADENQYYDLSKGACGDHVYFPANRTILWRMTAEKNCLVTISVLSSLQISLRIDIQPADFYKSGGKTTFLDRMAALLGIPIYRIRICGIFRGSTIISFYIVPENGGQAGSSSQQAGLTSELEGYQQKLNQKIAEGKLDLGAPILGVSFAVSTTTGQNVATTDSVFTVCRYNSTTNFTLLNIHSSDFNRGTVDVKCNSCTDPAQCAGANLLNACNQNLTTLGSAQCTRDVYCHANCTQLNDFSYCATVNGTSAWASMTNLCRGFCDQNLVFNFTAWKTCNYTECGNVTCGTSILTLLILFVAAIAQIVS